MGYVCKTMGWLINFIIRLLNSLKQPSMSPIQPNPAPVPENPPQPQPEPVASYLTTILPWISQKNNYHNVGVIADIVGLTPVQKLTLRGCIFQESRFLTNPKPNENIDPKTGQVWSTDYGITQVNDYWNIGPGKQYPNVLYVLNNPQICVENMAKVLKETGQLKPWASFTSGAYIHWIKTGSPMFELAT